MNMEFLAFCPECDKDTEIILGWVDGDYYGGECTECKKEIESKARLRWQFIYWLQFRL